MKPIHIDLTDLTEEHLGQAYETLGQNFYDAPCIIGTLMSEEERKNLAAMIAADPADEIATLIDRGIVRVPAHQRSDAIALQEAFDGENWNMLVSIAVKYMLTPVT